MSNIPNYLKNYADLYADNPRAAALQWFREARYDGLFLHYGLYSLIGRHEWVQLRELIPVAEYAKLIDDFTAENFDAERIAQFAVDCGMKYINITTRHHDSFCLFDTAETDFNSTNAPAGRDLIKELAEACDRHALGLCLYYSHGRDWKHPHAPNNDEWGGQARPKYDPPRTELCHWLRAQLANISRLYAGTNHRTTHKLRTRSRNLAGRCLPFPTTATKQKFKSQELYDYIHSVQPQVLVSYKQGLLGTEDFQAPEHQAVDTDRQTHGNLHDNVFWTRWKRRIVGLSRRRGPTTKTEEEVWTALTAARESGCNLLLNTGPLPEWIHSMKKMYQYCSQWANAFEKRDSLEKEPDLLCQFALPTYRNPNP